MKDRRIVIIGNGGAAISAVKAARASGHSGEIHVVSDTDAPAFNPMLSPYYLKGIIPWEHCFPIGESFYREYDITCHFSVPIEELDTNNQRVTMADGKTLIYDKCLIASGARPVIPPVPGLKGSPHVYSLRTAESAINLEKAIITGKKAIVLGASLVGLKVAEILSKKKIDVILLDVVSQMLSRNAHQLSATFLKKYFEEHGIDIRLGCAMEGMTDANEGTACHFSGNIIEEVDFVVVCTGVRPNIGFVDPLYVDIGQAVITDERMQSKAGNLYAAGDASEAFNIFSGKHEWAGTWGSACRQGRVAGCNMAGGDAVYPGSIPENISPFFEWMYAQLGDVHLQRENSRCVAFGDPGRQGHFVLVFDGDVLIGANLINCTHLAGKLRRAIAQRWHWGAYLEDFDQDLAESWIEQVLNEMLTASVGLPILRRSREKRTLCCDCFGKKGKSVII